MSLPIRHPNESKEAFVGRAYINETVKAMYPSHERRLEVCLQNACEAGMNPVAEADFMINSIEYGWTEEVTAENWFVPADDDYIEWNILFSEEGYDEETELWDVSEAKPGLWENIRKKKEREGKKYKPAKKGDKDRPDPDAWKKAQSLWGKTIAEYEEGQMQREQLMKMHKQLMEIEEYLEGVKFEDWTKDMISKAEIYIQNIYDFVEANSPEEAEAGFKYEDPKTGEIYTYKRKGIYRKDGRVLVPAKAAEYQGRKVQLGKPFRTPKGPKKSAVYVKNGSGKVVIVRFCDPDMKIKKSDPARRKSFRARHNCSNPGPRWKARYWSCRAW